MKLENGYKKQGIKWVSMKTRKRFYAKKETKYIFFEVVFLKGHNLRNKWIYLVFLYDLRLQIYRNIS